MLLTFVLLQQYIQGVHFGDTRGGLYPNFGNPQINHLNPPPPHQQTTGNDDIDIVLGGFTNVIGGIPKWLKNPPLVS